MTMLDDLIEMLCDLHGPYYVIEHLINLGYSERDLLDAGFDIADVKKVKE